MADDWIDYNRTYREFTQDVVDPVGYLVEWERTSIQRVGTNPRARVVEKQQTLIGHVNALGGICDDCPELHPQEIIHRYKRVWEPSS